MENLPWGVYVTAAGMGTVLALLLVLMLVLMAVGRLDRRRPAAAAPAAVDEAPDAPASDGLTADEVAAITIAVLTHVRVRRGQAAPAMRDVQPGSQLFASRWVAAGRAHQKRPWR